jgi:hypothetical protein
LFEASTVRLLAAEIEERMFAKLASMSEDEVLQLLNSNTASGLIS